MQKLHLQYSDDQKIFFTSDLHIGHRNVLGFCNRPFNDVKDMSDGFIANWNSVVGENDIVFDLGDMFWWDSRHDIRKFVEKLNGKIYKIPGNHDPDCRRLFELCSTDKVMVCDDTVECWITGVPGVKGTLELFLSHMPQATWPHRSNGAINLFGHIHSGPRCSNRVDVPGKDLFLHKDQQYDVGVDNNNYTPVELCEILKKMSWKRKM